METWSNPRIASKSLQKGSERYVAQTVKASRDPVKVPATTLMVTPARITIPSMLSGAKKAGVLLVC